jgi:uncharacterized membrane protein
MAFALTVRSGVCPHHAPRHAGVRTRERRARSLFRVTAHTRAGPAPGLRWRGNQMQSYRTVATDLRHPVNIALHTNVPLGGRIANAVTGFMGSWRFIILQTIVVAVWVLGNIYLLFHFDPYPFIFLNLAFSTQAAYAAPLILLASNQSAARDRATLEHAAMEAEEADDKDDDLRLRLERIEAMLVAMTAPKA